MDDKKIEKQHFARVFEIFKIMEKHLLMYFMISCCEGKVSLLLTIFSVVGLNFDFLVLNIIGFTCYTFYNVLMYFDMNVQDIYERTHPHTHIPVLLNDVVFAVHALFACIVTALQCFFYERGGQRVSYTCSGISSAFILFAVISFILSMTDVINTLQFIMFLSYVKMAVTLCKYFPQVTNEFKLENVL
ncbi:unnamed protein product [Anisakis simplex]|uniref:Cystinosin homolog (inferred by orthology to a C. elegans protein) n=1 Tax=Anisakis simplex TaxID=6269 RepID=A0A0M3J8U3_ANISI|nr:unnamed protein product [Anisakis simplex]